MPMAVSAIRSVCAVAAAAAAKLLSLLFLQLPIILKANFHGASLKDWLKYVHVFCLLAVCLGNWYGNWSILKIFKGFYPFITVTDTGIRIK
jgi:hypothetical protein